LAPLAQAQVVLEVTGHYHHVLIQYLHDLDVSVFVLHPQTRLSGLLKTDKRDALSLANVLYAQLEKGIQLGDPLHAVRRLAPPTPAALRLRGMVRHRCELINETTQRKNKLTAIGDELFPELTQICKDPNLPSALALRRRFPTPAALANASVEDLLATRVGHRPADDQLVQLRALARESIGVRAVERTQGLVFEQEQLIDELQLLSRHLERLEAEMAQIVASCREGQILTSIPGVGSTPAAAILAGIGNIANFTRAAQLKSYFGWAPTLIQSGRSVDHARLSPRGSRVMKRTLYLVVWKAIQVDESEWKQLYEKLLPPQVSV
jgi:transposase